jgi:hypothetical protein
MVSFTVFTVVVAVGVRSFLVQDAVTWSMMSEEPMTEAAMHFAASRHFTGNFIALYRFRSISVLRGIVSVRRYETQTPLSRWDDPFKDHVNKAQRVWTRAPATEAARGYQPGGARGRLGFSARTMPVRGVQWKGTEQDITFPLWPIALVTAIAPALWLKRALRDWRRRRRGLCVACGYDMRGLDGRRCPECGMLPVGRSRMAVG